MIGGVHAQMPDHRFALVGDVTCHHDVAFWRWQMQTADGSVVVAGSDTAVVSGNTISVLTGFFENT